MTDEQHVIPLIEEQVSVTKRHVETGRVRVHTRVHETQQMVRQQLARDEVEIERVAVNRVVTDMPKVRQEGGATIVPVVEEVLFVEKKLMLVEEIYLRRKLSHEEYAQPVTLRSQRVEIEREASSGDPMTSKAKE